MEKVRKVVSLLLTALMLTSMMAGCSSSAQTAAAGSAAPAADSAAAPAATAAASAAGAEDKVIRVGVICAMTGGSAIYGEGAQNAVDMAVEEINASDSEYKILKLRTPDFSKKFGIPSIIWVPGDTSYSQ